MAEKGVCPLHIDKKTVRNIFFVAVGAIAFYWILNETQQFKGLWSAFMGMISPFLLGAAIAFILNVPMRVIERPLGFIQNAGLRRTLAIILTFVIFVLLLTGVVLLLIPQIGNTVNALVPQILLFVEEAEVWLNEFLARNPQLMQWVYTITGLESD